jgi:hypothetical protein
MVISLKNTSVILKENILNARTYALAEDVASGVVESFTT